MAVFLSCTLYRVSCLLLSITVYYKCVLPFSPYCIHRLDLKVVSNLEPVDLRVHNGVMVQCVDSLILEDIGLCAGKGLSLVSLLL